MLIQQYATNHDGPDQGGNNMRALRRRDESGRFTFHVWDMEYTMWYEGEHRNIDGDVPDSPCDCSIVCGRTTSSVCVLPITCSDTSLTTAH